MYLLIVGCLSELILLQHIAMLITLSLFYPLLGIGQRHPQYVILKMAER